MLRAIRRYEHSSTIRFAFINDNFVVFHVDVGPCVSSTDYWIMNDPSSNMFYRPGERPGDISPVPGDVSPTQGPWMTRLRSQ